MDNVDVYVAILIVIFGAGSAFTLYLQNRIQKLMNLEEKLREERRKAYIELLAPLIYSFSKPPDTERAIKLMQSFEYRKNSFEVMLLGSDNVIQAYGNLMQHIYKSGDHSKFSSEEHTRLLIKLWAILLLEIRKDFGNSKTKLKEKDMLSHIITDIDTLL